MTDHRAEAERLLIAAGEATDTATVIQAAQVHAMIRATDLQERLLNQVDGSSRALLDTLANRWLEVADSNKPADGDRDDLADRFAAYRLIYLRTIRDLRHVLDTGRIPCSLMTTEERAKGDCGHQHTDEEDES